MSTIHRLRPRIHDRTADALQLMLELPLPLSEGTRNELTEALSSYLPEPWVYVMLSREQGRAIQRLINEGPRPGVTLNVWLAALSYAEYGSGEIKASRKVLAEQADTTTVEVSRALNRLVDIGGLVKVGWGKYALNPKAAWSGTLQGRERAVLQLVPA